MSYVCMHVHVCSVMKCHVFTSVVCNNNKLNQEYIIVEFVFERQTTEVLIKFRLISN